MTEKHKFSYLNPHENPWYREPNNFLFLLGVLAMALTLTEATWSIIPWFFGLFLTWLGHDGWRRRCAGFENDYWRKYDQRMEEKDERSKAAP